MITALAKRPFNGPSIINTPYFSANSAFLKTDAGITFSIPSAEQKRPAAKGRSADTANTTVLFKEAASFLNFLTEAAQTPVSMLGKILRIIFFPFKSDKLTSDRSPLTRTNSGAVLPTTGILPDVFTGNP